MLCVFAPYINPTKTSLNTSQNPYKPYFSSNSTHTLTTLSRTYQPIGAPQRPTVMELTQHNKIFTLAAKENRLSQSQDRQPTTGVIRRTHRQRNRNNQQKKDNFSISSVCYGVWLMLSVAYLRENLSHFPTHCLSFSRLLSVLFGKHYNVLLLRKEPPLLDREEAPLLNISIL